MAIGFGIVGAGMISRFHAKALAEVRGAKLVACADSAPGRAESLATELANRTRFLRDEVVTRELEEEKKGKGAVYGFYTAFKKSEGVTPSQFQKLDN